MKKALIFISIVLLFNIHIIIAEDSYISDQQNLTSREKIRSIETPVIIDFENPAIKDKWAIGATSPNCKKEITSLQIQNGGAWGLAVPDDQKKYCLGIKTGFKTRGYNFIEILPPVFSMDLYPNLKNLFPGDIPNPNNERFVPLPGNCMFIDVWAVGRNYRYDLEIWLKDWEGFVYPLNMGTLNFAGWQNLSKQIPGYVPQEEKYLPKEKPLKFLKFVLRSQPDERSDKFYCYLDHLKVISDLYIERIDGDDIKDKW